MGEKKRDIIHTEVCELLGVEYPIIAGGMLWISDANLASAVSEAGGFGVIASGSFLDEKSLEDEIKKARDLTKKPFGVNIPIFNPNSEWIVEVCIKMDVRIVITSAGSPERYTKRLKKEGMKVLHVVPNPRYAKKAEEQGVDCVIAEGIEGGGHKSVDEITTMCLIPQVVDSVKIPVVGAGGFWDARSFLAARFLGASGIQMGTRFILTKECQVHQSFKNYLLNLGDNGTLILGRGIKRVIRAAKNSLSNEILDAEKRGATDAELFDLMGPHRSMSAIKNGDIERGLIMAGQVAGCINEIKSVSEVINEIINGARDLLTSYIH